MKRIILAFYFVVFLNHSFANNDAFVKKNYKDMSASHCLYILNLGSGEGTFMLDEIKILTLDVYSEPNLKSKPFVKIDVNRYKYPAHYYKMFDDKTINSASKHICSKEVKNNFFKVTYKGKTAWLYKDSFYKVQRLDEYLNEGGGHKFYANINIYSKPNGLPINVNRKLDEDNPEWISLVILNSQLLSKRLWLEVAFQEDYSKHRASIIFKRKKVFPLKKYWITTHSLDKKNKQHFEIGK